MKANDKPLVLVKWVDAKFCPSLETEEEIVQHKLDEFNSLGYLVMKTELTTIIAAECNDSGQYRDITLIPTGSIQGIQELSPVSGV